MERLLISLTALIVLSLGNAHAESWILLGDFHPLLSVYADKDSGNKKGDIGTVNVRVGNGPVGPWTFDCKRRAIIAIDAIKSVDQSKSWSEAFSIACKPPWKLW